ncbi:helix-turn-helix protein [Herbihabitans rhizosphaerae]|uniref:Helix-turn-helix protein n=1 Tax=Herbihabitans rhizosphaerae TaxID=1872711 RepID=A0A4Q7KDW2_9PSEU|nr:Scr1 family TA system antitoxin-like transcriptional regulator [Herbihabitans rhizosphaerae]RZS31346.1 helix-turn-helix protein [Herbihabitans rhizosphaerae]
MARRGHAQRVPLGEALAAARNAAGLTQVQAASVLRCGQAKINKVEAGANTISQQDLDRLLRFYDPPADICDEILLLAAQASGGPSAGVSANRDYVKLLMLERTAREILVFHTERLPNILQSEQYLLTQYERAKELDDPNSILRAHREREHIFTMERPPRYRAVLSPSSFYRVPGGCDGRRANLVIDQAQHLVTLAARYAPHLTIQVLWWGADLPFVPHDHTVLRFDGEQKDQVYVEYGAGESKLYSGVEKVDAHVGYWEAVHTAALSQEDSQKFLLDLIDRGGIVW